MIHLKLQLIQMQQVSKMKKICIILCCLSCVINGLTGCSKKVESYTLGEWISEIALKLDLNDFQQQSPYYLNVPKDNEFYQVVQVCVEWGILDTKFGFDPDLILTKEWVAYTLINLIGLKEDTRTVKDVSKSLFPQHVANAVSFGLLEVDNRNCFNPQKIVSKEEAYAKLLLTIDTINDRKIDVPTNEVEWNIEITDIELPNSFDESKLEASFDKDILIKKDEVIHWKAEGKEYFYKVKDINETEDENLVELIIPELSEIVDSSNIENSFTIDFSKAIIEEGAEDFETSGVSYQKAPSVIKILSKEISYKDFKVKIDFSGGTLLVKLYKELKNGEQLYGEFNLHDVKPTFKWKTNNELIEDAYFRVNFSTTESLGIKRGTYKNLYSDLSFLKGDNFLNSLVTSFKEKKDIVETVIPVCTIKVPIPNMPLFTITMQLQLHIYASGRIELSINNNYVAGLEIKNNKMRFFNDNKHSIDFIMKGSTTLSLGVKTGLELSNCSLMDIGINGGVKGLIQTIGYIYDSDGKIQSKKIDVSLDVADDVSDKVEDVRICGDIKLHWFLDIVLNSKKSMAGKLNLTKTFSLLNDKNAPVIPNSKSHLENWMFIERCTRGNRLVNNDTTNILESDKIRVEKYNMIVEKGKEKKINIVGLPKGYKIEDLIFSSSDESVCKVTRYGNIQAIDRGNSIITIQTKDGIHTTKSNVLVVKNKDESTF